MVGWRCALHHKNVVCSNKAVPECVRSTDSSAFLRQREATELFRRFRSPKPHTFVRECFLWLVSGTGGRPLDVTPGSDGTSKDGNIPRFQRGCSPSCP